MMKKIATATAIFALANGASLQAAEPNQCIPAEKAEALFTYALPLVIGGAQSQCAASLPESAPLLQKDSEQFQKYVAASENAWPDAMDVIGIFAGDKLPAGMDLSSMRPFVEALIPAMLAKEIENKHCAPINQFYQLLEPMPVANLSEMTMLIVQLTDDDKDKKTDEDDADKKGNPFNICKTDQE